VPCVALMLFQEQGIPTACQGDIDALLTMVLFKRVAGRSSLRLLLFAGPVVASQTDNARYRNTLVVQVPDRERAFKAVKGVQNHYVAALGDHTRALTELAEAKDIQVICLDLP